MKQKMIAAILAAQMIATMCPTNTIMAAQVDTGVAVETSVETTEESSENVQVDDTQATDTVIDVNTEDASNVSVQGTTEEVTSVVEDSVDAQELYGAGSETAESDFTWNGNTITKYKGSSTNVVIPSRATAIASRAFEGNVKIESVVIPEKVASIGAYAFRNCTNLSE